MNKVVNKIHGRHGARWAAVQGIYAWILSSASIASIEADLNNQQFEIPSVKLSFDKAYLHELLVGITSSVSLLDEMIERFSERPLEEINPVELSILRVAVYELKEKIETPYRVIINEAILLAKEFGAVDSHKFINSVLDGASGALSRRV